MIDTITDPTCWDTTKAVGTLELIATTSYTDTRETLVRLSCR